MVGCGEAQGGGRRVKRCYRDATGDQTGWEEANVLVEDGLPELAASADGTRLRRECVALALLGGWGRHDRAELLGGSTLRLRAKEEPGLG